MGRRATPWWSTFWSDKDVEEWPIHKRYLFWFLSTNELATSATSGVYYITRRRIHRMSDLPLAEIDRWLLTEGTKNISYDAHHNVVFIENKLRYMTGGRPDLVAKSIIGDYWANPKCREIWRRFRNKYRKMIEGSPILHEHFFQKIDLRQTDEEQHPMFLSATPLTPYADDLSTDADREKRIQELLNRYGRDLPSDDVDRIFKVYDHLSTDRRGKRVVASRSRVFLLERIDKEPVELIARAAYVFLKADGIKEGKNQKYFLKIVTGGARTWYTEFKSERDKLMDKKAHNETEHPKEGYADGPG